MAENTTEGLSKDLPYDLRQVYGVDLVGEHLKDIARARKSDDYANYYKSLNDLYIIVYHKIKEKKVSVKDESGKAKILTAAEYYKELLNQAVVAANQYPNEWTHKDKTPEGCAVIETALNAIEMFLYEKMEEAKMFGSSKTVAGL